MEFNYFYTINNLEPSGLSFLWNFSGSAGSTVNDISPLSRHPGIVNDPSSFWSSGSGYFTTGNYVEVSGATGISTEQFTVFLDMKRESGNADVFLTSYATGDSSPTGGFSIGFNDTNEIYVETYGSSVQTKVFSVDLGSQNIVAIRKSGRNFSLTYYDVTCGATSTDEVLFNDNFVGGSCPMYVGANPLQQHASPASSFNGYINSLAYIEDTISNSQLDSLFSGLKVYDSVPVLATGQLLSSGNETRYYDSGGIPTGGTVGGDGSTGGGTVGGDIDTDTQNNIDQILDMITSGVTGQSSAGGLTDSRFYFTGVYNNITQSFEVSGNFYNFESCNETHTTYISYSVPYATTGTINASYEGVSEYHQSDNGGGNAGITVTNSLSYD